MLLVLLILIYFISNTRTVEDFNLAALYTGYFTCKIILALSVLANSNHTVPVSTLKTIKLGIVLIFVAFNFAVVFCSRTLKVLQYTTFRKEVLCLF